MADDDPGDPAAAGGNTLDGRLMAEFDAGRLCVNGQFPGELVGIAGLV